MSIFNSSEHFLLKTCIAILKVIELVCCQQTGEDGGEGAIGNQATSAHHNFANQITFAELNIGHGSKYGPAGIYQNIGKRFPHTNSF